MSISSVSSVSNNSATLVSNENSIKQLEKQKADLEQQIQAENNSKDDTKTKQQKVQLLQNQLTLIESQISQKSAQQTQTTNSGQQQQSISAKTAENKDENDLSNIADLVKGHSTDKKIDVLF